MDKSAGYEYEQVGVCKKTGRPILAPKAWNQKLPGSKAISPRPHYATCLCCGRKR